MQDLSKFNRDHATFLPAISGFYTGMLSRQQDRVPAGFERGIDGMNFLDPDNGYFFYDTALYSAGHAYLDLEKSIDHLVSISSAGTTHIGDNLHFDTRSQLLMGKRFAAGMLKLIVKGPNEK